MKTPILYCICFVVLLISELLYFRIADYFNIIDKPNQRSSHSTIVLRGGGIIFLVGAWLWSILCGFQYPWMLAAVTLAAGISFIDDIHSLPDATRLIVQFISMSLIFYELDIIHLEYWWIIILALFIFVGATNIINFMDGINGMTAGYSIVVLSSLYVINHHTHFISESFLVVTCLSIIIFSFFNFRPRGKAKCFAGDVGSVGIGMILLFAIGKLIFATNDPTWLILLVVYGIDGCLTIIHRIMLHEKLGEAHRKHAYQIMANELHLNHMIVSLIYMLLQGIISLTLIYVIPNTALAHWIYLGIVILIISVSYVVFMRKYYHLHSEYLQLSSSNDSNQQ